MSNSWKQARRIMLLIFVATTGWVACDSATAPDQSVAEVLRTTDRQVVEEDLVREVMEKDAERRQAPIFKAPAE